MENSVWVYAENDGATIADVSLELIGKGRELADQVRSELGALIIGDGVSSLAPELIAYGADKVYVAEHPQLKYYLTLPYTRIAVELIKKYRPSILLIGGTNTGRDLAPTKNGLRRIHGGNGSDRAGGRIRPTGNQPEGYP